MHSTGLVLGFAAAIAFSAALPSTSDIIIADLPGEIAPLPRGDLGWEGVVVEGEPPVEVWGATFEDIEAKIREKYNKDFSIFLEEENETPASSENKSLKARRSLEARAARNINCDRRYGESVSIYLDQARDALRRINGNSCKARARTCILNMCIGNGHGIGMCNDNHHLIDIPCTTIADMAQEIGARCVRQGPPHCDAQMNCFTSPWDVYEAGQGFSPGLTWNVIVGACGFFGNTGERPVKA